VLTITEDVDADYDNHEDINNDKIELSPDMRLANASNAGLRVLIAPLRPILDHPHQPDVALKMIMDPRKRKRTITYDFCSCLLACVRGGGWNDTRLGFVQLLDEAEPLGCFTR